MFHEKRTLLFLQKQSSSVKGKRLVFEVNGAEKEKEHVEKNKETPVPTREIIDDLKKQNSAEVWDGKKNANENMQKLAEKIYPSDKNKQAGAKKVLLERLGRTKLDMDAAEKTLRDSHCDVIWLKDGQLKFFNSNLGPQGEILLRGAAITIDSEPAPQPAPVEGGKKNELSPEEKADINEVQNFFPTAQVSVNGEKMSPGKYMIKNSDSYEATTVYSKDAPKGKFLGEKYYDHMTHHDAFLPTNVLTGNVIEVKQGNRSVLYVKTEDGWVDMRKLFTPGANSRQAETLNDWNKEPVYSGQVQKGMYKLSGNSEFIDMETHKSLLTLSNGQDVEVIDEKVRKIGDKEYIFTRTNLGSNQSPVYKFGWIEKGNIGFPVQEKKLEVKMAKSRIEEQQELSVGGEKFKLGEDFTLDPDGTIHFRGKRAKQAEAEIKVIDIFKNLQKNDRIEITPKSGRKRVCVFNGSDVVFAGGANKGQHAEILEGYKIVLPNTVEMVNFPEDIPVAGTYELQQNDNYTDIAKKIMKGQAPFADSKYNLIRESAIQENSYAAMLKDYHEKYPTGNTLYLVVPNKSRETAMEEYTARANASKEIEKSFRAARRRNAQIDSYNSFMNDEVKKENINSNIIDLLQNDKKNADNLTPWEQAWKDGKIEGVMRIKNVLKEEPLFAGMSDNALRDILPKLIKKGSIKDISVADIVEDFYKKQNGEKGDYGDFKKEYREVKKKVDDYPQAKRDAFMKHSKDVLDKNAYFSNLYQEALKARQNGDTITENRLVSEMNKPEMRAAARQVDAFMNSPEYKEYSEWKTNFDRLTYLDQVLTGSHRLLEAIGNLSTVETRAETFAERNYATLKQLDEPAGMIVLSREKYYSMRDMVTDKADNNEPAFNLDNPKSLKIGILDTTSKKFDAVASNACGQACVDKFKNDADKLRLLFRVYSLSTLIESGCLKQAAPAGRGRYVLIDLPQNFTTSPEVKNFMKGSPDGKINDQTAGLDKLRDSLDENQLCLDVLHKIFNIDKKTKVKIGTAEGSELTMEGIASHHVTADTPDYFDQNFAGEAGFKNMKDRIVEYNGTVAVMKAKKTMNELNNLIQAGLIALNQQEGVKVEDIYKKYGGRDQAMKKLEIKDLKTDLTQDQIDLIRIGFVTKEKITEVRESTEYSKNPLIADIQKKLVEQGYPADQIKVIESNFPLALGVMVDTTQNGWKKITAGVGTYLDVGNGFAITLGAGFNLGTGQPALGIGIGKSFEVGNGVKVGVGGGIGGGQGGLAGGPMAFVTWPLEKSDWDATLGAGVTLGILGVNPAGGVAFSYNAERARDNAVERGLKAKGIDAIEAESDPQAKVNKIMANPYFGELFRTIKAEGGSDELILGVYEQEKTILKNQAIREQKVPPILSFGVAVSPDIIGSALATVGYLTIKIGDDIVIVRQESKYAQNMDAVTLTKQNAAIEKQVRQKYGEGTPKFSDKTLGSSPRLITDPDSGKIGIIQSQVEATAQDFTDLKKANETLKEANIYLRYDQNTKLIEVVPLGVEDSNVEISADPGMGRMGLVLRDNKIYLAAGINPTMVFRRGEYKYAYSKEGSTKHTLITVSDNPARSPMDIRDNSKFIIYKREGQAYMIREGETTNPQNNIMSWEAYNNPGTKGLYKGNELYNEGNQVPADFKESTDKMQQALNAREVETNGVRKGLFTPAADGKPSFIDEFWNRHQVDYRLDTAFTSPNYDSSKVVEKIKEDAGKRADLNTKNYPLNATEVNMLLMQLMIRSFSKLGENPAERRRVFEVRLQWAKERILKPMFAEKRAALKARGIELKYSDDELAEIAINDLRSINIENVNAPVTTLPNGTLFSSAAGLFKEGFRSVVYRNGNVEMHGMLDPQDYSKYLGSKTDPQRAELATLLLEGLSPLGKEDKEFIESPLAIRMAGMRPLWFLLGKEDFDKVRSVFENRSKKIEPPVPADARAAFDKFKSLVTAIRDAELSGANEIKFNNYIIRITKNVGAGAYDKCSNYTMFANEDIQVLAPPEGVNAFAGRGEATNTVSPEVAHAIYGFSIFGGVKVNLPQPSAGGPPVAPPTPPPPTRVPATPTPNPKPAPGVGQNPGAGTGGVNKGGGGGTGTGGGNPPSGGGGGE